MRMHEPTEPTLNEHGDETHPAFGMVSVSRITSTPPATLFDSEIQHGQFIRLTLNRATRKRDLARDWLHGESADLVVIDMSEAQWASLVSSINTSGVPVTIRALPGQRNLPGLVFNSRLALSAKEATSSAAKTFEEIRERVADLVEIESRKHGVKERREAVRALQRAVTNVGPNIGFAARSLTEHVENVVVKARADIEAVVASHAQHLGIESADPDRLTRALTEATVAVEGETVEEAR